ncbi:hypothetical protein PLANTIT3_60260 [Plantibacter sp. T3]|nr:hypothetical protein PLANTIT3_60260 [Plantibacter sp. T3]
MAPASPFGGDGSLGWWNAMERVDDGARRRRGPRARRAADAPGPRTRGTGRVGTRLRGAARPRRRCHGVRQAQALTQSG